MSSGRARRGPLPPVYFLAALLVAIGLHRWLPIVTILPAPWNQFGVLPLVLGLGAVLVSATAFHKAGTAIKPFEDSSVLVTHGFYRYTRNPMYLGMLLTLGGIAMLLGSLSPFFTLPPLAYILTRRFIVREEAMLEARFGDEYRRFRERVRRWL